MFDQATNVIGFRQRRTTTNHPRGLMEIVYRAGSIPVAADDKPMRAAVRMLAALGFLVIDEITPEGELRRLTQGHALGSERPWRVSRPAHGGQEGEPDVFGYDIGSLQGA